MLFLLGAALVATACGSSGSGGAPPGEQAGSTCATAATCYPDVKDQTQIKGTVTCLSKVPNGYCTHLCTADTDCCAVPGECRTGLKEVCSPFENQPESYCFLSCEDAAVKAAGYTDANVYCQKLGNAAFTCRSTGGGASNRKICST
jgi:hypothetical protein